MTSTEPTETTSKSWLPEDPSIAARCSGCQRGIPDQCYNGLYTYVAHISTDDSADPLEGKWTFCLSCWDEVHQFIENDMTIDMDESAPSCGFCGDKRDLKDPGPTEFAFRPYQFEDAWEAVQLCQDCVGVLITYLDRVPEADHNGPDPNRNVFYPESLSENPVNISKEQADHVEILNKFNELSPGERVYFEAIRYGYENYITQYISGEAIVGKYDEGEFIGKSHWTPASKLEGVLFTPQPYDIYLEPKTGWERKNDWLRIQLNTPDRSGLKHNHGPDTVTVLRTI